MFNLPFPTDSLYKFSFMFGLVLIVFSFYYRDKQLNKFDKKQSYAIIDSLKISKSNIISSFWWDSLSMDHMVKHFKKDEWILNEPEFKKDIAKGVNKWRPYIYNRTDPSIVNDFNIILNNTDDHNSHMLLKCSFDLNKTINTSTVLIISGYQRNINFYSAKISQDSIDFKYLIVLGVFLFIAGTICWYFMIQRPQDKLLIMQVKQTEQQNLHSYKEFLSWKEKQEKNVDDDTSKSL